MAAKSAPARPRARQRTTKPPKAGPSATKWGDREGRRRDILAAARGQMAEGGYLALSMRDIARGAGVSPGTLYSYFATKEEIFATLYAEAIEAHNQRIEPICAGASDVEALLLALATAYLDLYVAYGRYFTLWSALVAEGTGPDSPLPVELVKALRSATFRQGDLVRTSLERVAASQDLELVDPPKVLPFLWSVLNGIGDHVTSERRHLSRFTTDELIAYAVQTVAAGITRPAR
ncbi:MAG: TetR/AcrR family transcriptional regulator [Actinobacteria bacterium]|nr:TetR/AcrR family transcriptional regulator [Actinomycetota bacterium]